MNRSLIKKVTAALIIMAVLVLSTMLVVSYVNKSLIPIRLKNIIIKKLSEQTGLAVNIESLKFGLRKGFTLEGISVYENAQNKNSLLVKADSLSFRVLIIPSFNKIRLTAFSAKLSGLYLNIIRRPDNTWNIGPLLKGGSGDAKDSRLSVIFSGFSFDKGNIKFTDNTLSNTFEKELTTLSGRLGLSLPDYVNIELKGRLDNKPVKINADYKIKKKSLTADVDFEGIEIENYAKAYMPAGMDISLSGVTTASLKLSADSFQRFKLNGDMSVKDLKVKAEEISITGDYTINGKANFRPGNLSNAEYSAEVSCDNAQLSNNTKLFENVKKIKGLFALTGKAWIIKEASCLYYGCPAEIKGKIISPHKDFTAEIDVSSELSLDALPEYINDITLEKGRARVSADIIYRKDASCELTGSADIKGLRLIQKDIILSGDFYIKGRVSGSSADWQDLEYKGSIDFNNASAEGINLLPLISDASGRALFTRESIAIKSLKAKAADTDISLTADFKHKKDKPSLSLNLKAEELSVSGLISSLPENIRLKFKDIDAKGNCSLDIHFSGIIDKPDTYDYSGSVIFKKGSLKLDYWPYDISDISSSVKFEKQKISWKNLSFSIKEDKYTSDGELKGFTEPVISAEIISDKLNAALETDISRQGAIKISKLSGKFRNSSFSFSGNIEDLKTAYAQIKGIVYLDMKDTPYIFTKNNRAIKGLKPDGTVKFDISMKGPLKDPLEWSLFLEGSSEAIILSGFTLNDFYLDYRMKDYFVDIPVLSAYAYNGIINISSRANLKTKEKPYIINMDIKDIDLHELIKDTEDKEKKIKGLFTSKAILNGYLNDKDSLHGNGWLQVSNGYLWEFPVVRGVMDIILMVPPENIILTDAFGNFSISNNRIYTDDFKMLSKAASLLWAGSLGFNGTLDFNITGRFAENVIKQTTEPGRIANAILHEAGSLIMEVRLTGTIKKPSYQIVPFPLKRIFQEKVVDRLNDIFGNIGE